MALGTVTYTKSNFRAFVAFSGTPSCIGCFSPEQLSTPSQRRTFEALFQKVRAALDIAAADVQKECQLSAFKWVSMKNLCVT